MAVRRRFEWFGVRDADAWEDAVAARSGNWPQHLSVYLLGESLPALPESKPPAEAESHEGGSPGGP